MGGRSEFDYKNMKKIKLGRSDEYTLVDDDVYEYISQWKWHKNPFGYVVRKIYLDKPRTIKRRTKVVFIHNVILERKVGMHTDHINHDKLDNQMSNLRYATISQNRMNSHKQVRNKSGYKGVRAMRGKWLAYITMNRKIKYIGYFDTREKAALAYNEMAVSMFGEFAYLNKL